MIEYTANGLRHVDAKNRNRLLGSYWKRLEPKGDGGDHVQIKGLTTLSVPDEDLGGMVTTDALVVASTTYGAVPVGWSSCFEAWTFDDLIGEYAPAEAPSAVLANAEAAIATAEAEAARFEARAQQLARLQSRAAEINAGKERS